MAFSFQNKAPPLLCSHATDARVSATIARHRCHELHSRDAFAYIVVSSFPSSLSFSSPSSYHFFSAKLEKSSTQPLTVAALPHPAISTASEDGLSFITFFSLPSTSSAAAARTSGRAFWLAPWFRVEPLCGFVFSLSE